MVPLRPLAAVSALVLAGLAIAAASDEGIARFGAARGPLGGSAAVRVQGHPLAHTAQVLPLDSAGNVVASDAGGQAAKALENLEQALQAGSSSLERAVRLNAVVRDARAADALARAMGQFFRADSRPAVTLVSGTLADPDALVALDAVAIADAATTVPLWSRSDDLASMSGETHVAILPVGPAVYVSGKAARGPVSEATADVIRQIGETLSFLGLDRSRVVRLKCFLRPMDSTKEAVEAIVNSFGGQAPPIVFVEWRNSQTIEIEAVAAASTESAVDSNAIEYLTPPGDRASPVFSRVALASHPASIYVSTLNGRTAGRGDRQIHEMFADLTALLSQAGSDLRHLAKATYYVADDLTSAKLNEIRPAYYDPRRPPAASKALVRGTAVAGRTLAVDMIAVPSD